MFTVFANNLICLVLIRRAEAKVSAQQSFRPQRLISSSELTMQMRDLLRQQSETLLATVPRTSRLKLAYASFLAKVCMHLDPKETPEYDTVIQVISGMCDSTGVASADAACNCRRKLP